MRDWRGKSFLPTLEDLVPALEQPDRRQRILVSLQAPTLPGDSVQYLSSKWCAGHLNFWSRNFRNSIFL